MLPSSPSHRPQNLSALISSIFRHSTSSKHSPHLSLAPPNKIFTPKNEPCKIFADCSCLKFPTHLLLHTNHLAIAWRVRLSIRLHRYVWLPLDKTLGNKYPHRLKNSKKKQIFHLRASRHQKEVRQEHHFKNKIVYCSCDESLAISSTTSITTSNTLAWKNSSPPATKTVI